MHMYVDSVCSELQRAHELEQHQARPPFGGVWLKKTPARVITCDPLDVAQLSRPKSIFSQLLIYWLMYINALKSNKNTMPYLEDLEV